jgi:conjugative transfer signal peptidase TraF
MSVKREWFVLGVIAVTAAVAVPPLLLAYSPLRFVSTDSVPTGLYWTGRTQLVGVCLSLDVIKSAERAGLILPKGECPNGRQTILKRLYLGAPDAPISFTQQGFIVQGKLLPNTAPKARSRKGVPLTHAEFGTYATGLWAISDYNPDSFDSRYFGPVAESQVRYFAEPFLLF